MYIYAFYILLAVILWESSIAQEIRYENDLNYRVGPGDRMCFFEQGKVGQILEAQYQVIDGQHGDWDISFEIIDPHGKGLLSDHKKSQNSIIMDVDVDGEYMFCLDNSFSMMNSKLVYVYVLIEDREKEDEDDAVVTVEEDGHERPEEEVLEWEGFLENGTAYYVEVGHIAASMTRILRHVVKARHLLDVYGAAKTRDSYLAREDTFIVDVWSGFQIGFMITIGLVQVVMIKKLFDRSGPAVAY